MSKVIVVTDSNSGITPDEAKKLGVEMSRCIMRISI